MSAIPDDVLAASRECWTTQPKEAAGIEHIARAIMAERKRCANIAKMFAGYTDSEAGEDHSKEAKRLAEDTAAWIWTEIMEPAA